jgi:hypothetical protein
VVLGKPRPLASGFSFSLGEQDSKDHPQPSPYLILLIPLYRCTLGRISLNCWQNKQSQIEGKRPTCRACGQSLLHLGPSFVPKAVYNTSLSQVPMSQ